MNICWNIFRLVVNSAQALVSVCPLLLWQAGLLWQKMIKTHGKNAAVELSKILRCTVTLVFLLFVLNPSHWGESEKYLWLYYTCSEHRDKYGCDLSTSEKEQWELACKIPKRYCHSAREMSVSAMCARTLQLPVYISIEP